VHQDDRTEAALLRAALLYAAFDNASSTGMMENYVKLCCCKRMHRATALDIKLVDLVAQRWLEQLYGQKICLANHDFDAREKPLN